MSEEPIYAEASAEHLFGPEGDPVSVPDVGNGDNSKGAHLRLLELNAKLRGRPWDPPFDRTVHQTHLGDARDLSWIEDESVHLVVTSPPYWTLKQYKEGRDGQMGDIGDYEQFLDELDKVWKECERVLVGG